MFTHLFHCSSSFLPIKILDLYHLITLHIKRMAAPSHSLVNILIPAPSFIQPYYNIPYLLGRFETDYELLLQWKLKICVLSKLMTWVRDVSHTAAAQHKV